MSAIVTMAKLPSFYSQLDDAANFAAAGALNDVAFMARAAVIKKKHKRFDIKQKWVANNTRVLKADKKQNPIMAQVVEYYWGLAQQEDGGARPGTKPEPWWIPNHAGKKWMKEQGMKKTPPLKKLLKAGGNRKPFVLRKRGGRNFERQLEPQDIDSGDNFLAVRLTTDRNPIKVIGKLQDAPLSYVKKTFFETQVAETYNKNIKPKYEARYDAEIKNRLARL